MSWSAVLGQTGMTLGAIALAMILVALIEVAVPLHARDARYRAHTLPNLSLTLITLATNIIYNVALVLLLAWLEARQFGLLRWLGLGPWLSACVGFVLLDGSFYVAHVCMHKLPALWRVHKVHHCDPVLDVTTSIRQHPLEGIIRYGFMAACACSLGVGLGAFAAYRAVSALNGLLEHANVRVSDRFVQRASWLTTWFDVHRIHHSRVPSETDSNYGNIFSWFDRLFGTFTPPGRGKAVACGLDDLDAPELQTTMGLLALPFAGSPAARAATRYVPAPLPEMRP